MAEIKWIKIMVDIFDNRKIRQIEKMPDADAILVIWLKILCLAGSLNSNGLILFTQDIPYTDEMLANEFNRPIQTIRLALKVFQSFGMLELHEDIYQIANWEKYQNVDGMDLIREQNRIRQQRKRLKDREESSPLLTETTDVTLLSRDVTQQNKNKNKNKSIDNKGTSPSSASKLDLSSLETEAYKGSQLKGAMLDYIEHRKKIRKPMSQKSLDLVMKKLERESKGSVSVMIAMLNQSIENGWTGVFPVTGNNSNGQKKTGNVGNFEQRQYDDKFLESFYEPMGEEK